jgi:hypothetical protein
MKTRHAIFGEFVGVNKITLFGRRVASVSLDV